MKSDCNLTDSYFDCRDCSSYEKEIKKLKTKLEQAATNFYDTEEGMLYMYKNRPSYEIVWEKGKETKKVIKPKI